MHLDLYQQFDLPDDDRPDDATIATASDRLIHLRSAAEENDQPEIAAQVSLLLQLLQLYCDCTRFAVGETPPDELNPDTLLASIRSGLKCLEEALEGASQGDRDIAEWSAEVRQRWSDWMPSSDNIVGSPSDTDDLAFDEDIPSAEDLAQFLETLSTAPSSAPSSATSEQHSFVSETDAAATVPVASLSSIAPPNDRHVSLDQEMREAFLDDAYRCLDAIEQAALRCDEHLDSDAIVAVCRELHTLKGASASVALTSLADYLHSIESHLEDPANQRTLTVKELLATIDTVRAGLPSDSPAGAAESTTTSPAATTLDEDSLRVPAARIDRLMDMLAELVMLRNQQEAQTALLRQHNDELLSSATRLRATGDTRAQREAPSDIREIAADLLGTARAQGETLDALSESNLSAARFIRSFRQELTAFRRLPLSGLFRRLQRAVREAAEVEQKQVRFEMSGEHAGLERSLQERLYEPLLHLVRNAVSHGIEDSETRVASGKDPCGTIVLEATGSSSLLILTIRDDGQGLDYDALRRRGIEKGLLSADQHVSREQLAKLIFQPGFSTRSEANAVSGRGMGMDIVAETLQRMGSWIEIDSHRGCGSELRLHVPLPSVIEHAMLFRCGGQLFAIPMPALAGAADREAAIDCEAQLRSLHDLLELDPVPQVESRQRLVLANPTAKSLVRCDGQSVGTTEGAHWELEVDEIVGPEELVVRPLPPLLRSLALLRGLTLAGSGEVVLILDPHALRHRVEQSCDTSSTIRTEQQSVPNKTILLIDDAVSARRTLHRFLEQRGIRAVEACSGMDGLNALESDDFFAIFTDIEMPEMSGFDVLEAVQSQAIPVPVVMVSSRDDDAFRERAIDMGASGYLTKPVDPSRLQAVLDELATSPTPSLEGVPS